MKRSPGSRISSRTCSEDKELFLTKNTKKHFKDRYNDFGRHPEKVLAFFDKQMK